MITMIRASVGPDSSNVRIRAARTITSFQRPERTSDGFILRLPATTMEPGAVDSSASATPLKCTAERIRDILVLRFRCAPTDTMTIRRDGQRDLVCTIRPLSDVKEDTQTPNNGQGKWSLDVIVIDAGHGGQDAGAEGVNGVYELSLIHI